MIIGITGIFGSGKTTVANMFSKCGFHVINVDKLYHGIYRKNLILKFRIRKEFGTLDRNKIRNIVFSDLNTRKNGTFFVSQKLRKLNQITHPTIIKAIKKEINKIKKNHEKYTKIASPKLRNVIAGYVSRLIKQAKEGKERKRVSTEDISKFY